jgi:lipopolysaccharide/colanic/teichoic acid biosynthesis glycosyltransferase
MPDADSRPATTRPARTASFFAPVPTLVDSPTPAPSRPATPRRAVKRAVDVAVSSLFLLVLLPVVALVALAVKLESRGPVFYGALRVGRTGETFRMLKFRKMHHGATGMRLTTDDDQRLTRVGSWLTKTKLDELPQFWNVLVGDMSLIGPRPEDPYFVELRKEEFEDILAVRPGVTGFSQIAFAEESRILDGNDPLNHYLDRILPQKLGLDRMYASTYRLRFDFWIFFWTVAAVLARRQVAVHRQTGAMNLRRRPAASRPAHMPALARSAPAPAPAPVPAPVAAAATPHATDRRSAAV